MNAQNRVVVVLLLALPAAVLALLYCGAIENFSVVAEPRAEVPPNGTAVAISRWLFGGLVLAVLVLLGWFGLGTLRR